MNEIESSKTVVNATGTDIAVVLGGLLLGVGLISELIYQTAGKKSARVFNATNIWFMFSGVMHCWIEYTMAFYRGSSLLQGPIDYWASADFRYGNFNGYMESGTASMEAITGALVGPLCLVLVVAAVHDLPWRYPLQLVVCTMQLYGMLWQVAQAMFSTETYLSSDPNLFYGVVVAGNLPWAIVTPVLWVCAWNKIVSKMK